MRRALIALLILLASTTSGCVQNFQDGIDSLVVPRAVVSMTPLSQDGWNRDGHVGIDAVYNEPVTVSFEVTPRSGGDTILHQTPAAEAKMESDGLWKTTLDVEIPDGDWDLRLAINDRTFQRFLGVRIDSTPPTIDGLEDGGKATDGSYVLGANANVSDGKIQVVDSNGEIVATSLPANLTGLTNPIHVFQVIATDEAANRVVRIVQVFTQEGELLPEGEATFGIVSRYTIQAELWDLSRADEYLMPAAAQSEQPGYTGEGYGITPEDPVVRNVVEAHVDNSMTTMEIALELYEWMFDTLEYDDARLASQTLMLPRHVIEDSEDDDAEVGSNADAGKDGLSDDGSGNGVAGGVCRDLAGTYVSLLRAAGVPARLVTGYLAGEVDGFHAWVEVYVGVLDNQPAWVPVDVSPINGRWDEDFGFTTKGVAITMQSFGIRLPDYLPLRTLAPEEEVKGWSQALGVSYEWQSTRSEPVVSFHKQTVHNLQEMGVMCVHTATMTRELAVHPDDCTEGNAVFGWDQTAEAPSFALASVQLIDYGILVESAPRGAEFDVQVAYPFADELQPVTVEYRVYEDRPGGVRYRESSDGNVHASFTY